MTRIQAMEDSSVETNGTGEPADLVITAGAIATMDAQRQIQLDGAVAVRGTRIVAVGRRADILARYRPETLIEEPGSLLTPGLIDAHQHPASGYLVGGGFLDELPPERRLAGIMAPHEKMLTPHEAYVGSLATYAEMIRHGTTTFIDAGSPQSAETVRAAERTGMRGVIVPRTSDLPGMLGREPATVREVLGHADEVYDRFNGSAGGRIQVWYGLDDPTSVSDELIQGVVAHAADRDTGVAGHFIGRRPPSDIAQPERNADLERYERFGVLELAPVLAHIGWLPEGDVKRLADTPAFVAHCPATSLLGGQGWVAHGVIPDLAAAGTELVLGTDAAAISRFLDLVRVMYLAAVCHKDARRDYSVMPVTSVFEMATVNAAKAMRASDRLGSVEAGKTADLALFDLSSLAYRPFQFGNPVADLVYAGSGADATTVVIDGRVVLRDRVLTTVDVEEVAEAVDEAAGPALDKLGGRRPPQWPISR
ncbi:amidohydrolase family protein [Streptomyces ureilyticus]|uniref:Amidohydrolase family protein n=1 Tax=Streptomyces ureilyticus TaxID=1775131 RepID=A0ABX0DWT6_9ACTN|nr:amidohydrolase family protein [Streptomyces ureilyticus]NGO46391.1 amidohydrolase family protein [Streptomyces ureilyticus]